MMKSNLEEVRASLALRLYGVALGLTHVWTWLFWKDSIPKVLSREEVLNVICWPFLTHCAASRLFSVQTWNLVFYLYLTISLISCLGFLKKRWVGLGMIGLFILGLFKYLTLLQDYRMMGNYHYMPLLASFAFLFFPQKQNLVQILTVGFYLAAGSLKLNIEWLSGASIGRHPDWISSTVFQWACAYVVVLEIAFSWLLLSSHNRWRMLALIQFLFFHLISWYWVHYFYPLNMFCLLSIFPLIWSLEPRSKFAIPTSISSRILLAGFAVAQIIPLLSPVDPALEGHWRIAALNMFDSRSQCLGTILSKYKDGVWVESIPRTDHYAVRVHCDPIFYENEARKICALEAKRDDFISASAFLNSKRTTDDTYVSVLRRPKLCTTAERP